MIAPDAGDAGFGHTVVQGLFQYAGRLGIRVAGRLSHFSLHMIEQAPRQLALLALDEVAGHNPARPPQTVVAITVNDRVVRHRVHEALSACSDFKVTIGRAAASVANVNVVLFEELQQPDRRPYASSSTRVVALGNWLDDSHLFCALSLGIRGCAKKFASADELTAIVRKVAAGDRQVLEVIARRHGASDLLMTTLLKAIGNQPRYSMTASPFTQRESQILAAVVSGESGTVIAGRLHIAKQTVKNCMQDIFTKTGTHTRAHAAAMAVANGWVRQPEHNGQ